MASHFFWGLWSILQAKISTIEFGYLVSSLPPPVPPVPWLLVRGPLQGASYRVSGCWAAPPFSQSRVGLAGNTGCFAQRIIGLPSRQEYAQCRFEAYFQQKARGE